MPDEAPSFLALLRRPRIAAVIAAVTVGRLSAYDLGSGLAALVAGALLSIWSLTATLLLLAAVTTALGATALLGGTRTPAPAPAEARL